MLDGEFNALAISMLIVLVFALVKKIDWLFVGEKPRDQFVADSHLPLAELVQLLVKVAWVRELPKKKNIIV